MKKVIPFVGIVLMAAGLAELLNLAFYLMNQPSTFSFNVGLLSLMCIFIAFGFLGRYTFKYFSSLDQEENKDGE